MRIQMPAAALVSGLALMLAGVPAGRAATAAADPFEILNAIPALPANVAAAGAATQIATGGDHGPFTAPAYDALALRITTALQPKSLGTTGGIDLNRAASDPAYAAQMQARMQSMTTAEKMAMANQMMAAQQAGAGDPRSAGQIAAFLGAQRSADMVAQQKMRALLEGALGSTGAQHRAADARLNAAAKACPQGKTGWPLETCTDPLGSKSIAEHHAIEDAALASEAQALGQARAVALAELNKGRDLLTHATGPTATPLEAWALVYVQLLDDYAKAMTLRAGFWAHANASKYTGQVTSYIHAPASDIFWPLQDPAYTQAVRVGL